MFKILKELKKYFFFIEPEVDALIKASIIILRKCSTQKIPLRTEWCPYSFPLPKASLLVNQTSSTSTSGKLFCDSFVNYN